MFSWIIPGIAWITSFDGSPSASSRVMPRITRRIPPGKLPGITSRMPWSRNHENMGKIYIYCISTHWEGFSTIFFSFKTATIINCSPLNHPWKALLKLLLTALNPALKLRNISILSGESRRYFWQNFRLCYEALQILFTILNVSLGSIFFFENKVKTSDNA